MSAPIQPQPQPTDLPTLIRAWLHYQKLCTDFRKQSDTSRKICEEYEKRILAYLDSKKLKNPTIQISGGAKIQVVHEKSFPCLTIGRLEQYLHSYFARKGQLADETAQIMQFIKQQKSNNFELVQKLKKIPVGPQLPLPPTPEPDRLT